MDSLNNVDKPTNQLSTIEQKKKVLTLISEQIKISKYTDYMKIFSLSKDVLHYYIIFDFGGWCCSIFGHSPTTFIHCPDTNWH